jgi:predicted 3-demethylubiquinone-9 3-methyltransferase (glyoxalase superfamily)
MYAKITPHLWLAKEAEEAAEFTSVFPKSKIKDTMALHNTPSGSVDIVPIELLGQEFMLIEALAKLATLVEESQ